MAHFIEVLFIGLMLSSTYILIATGFTLFFGAIDIVHFAHGDVAMLGAFIGIILYFLAESSGLTQVLPMWLWSPGVILATLIPVSYTHLTLPTTCTPCSSRWSPDH